MILALLLAAATVIKGPGPGPDPDVIYQHPDERTCIGKAQVLDNAAWATSRRFRYDHAATYSEQASRQLSRCISQHERPPADVLDASHDMIWAGEYSYAAGNRLRACRLVREGWGEMRTWLGHRSTTQLTFDERDSFTRDRDLAIRSFAGDWGAWPLANHRSLVHVHGDPPCPAS